MIMTPWVMRLIIANIAVYFLSRVFPQLLSTGMFIPSRVHLMPWTVFTYMFLHAGTWHLIFNMLGLFFFGRQLEIYLGARNFLWLYFISGLVAAVVSFIFAIPDMVNGGPPIAILGSSGAVFGVVFAFARYWPRTPVYLWGVVRVEARWLVVGFLVWSIFGGVGQFADGIAHFAHLGGLVGGAGALWWIERRNPGHRMKRTRHKTSAADARRDLDRWSRINREEMHQVNHAELDRVMAKIESSGIESLSLDERAFLDRFSPDD